MSRSPGVVYGALIIVVCLILISSTTSSAFLFERAWVRNNYELGPNYFNTLKIFFSSLVGLLFCRVFLTYSNINPWSEMLIGGLILVFTYLVLILIAGVLTKENLGHIERIVSSYGFMLPVINFVFGILNRIARE